MNLNNNYITPIAKQKMLNPKHYSSLPKYLYILRILFKNLTENYTFSQIRDMERVLKKLELKTIKKHKNCEINKKDDENIKINMLVLREIKGSLQLETIELDKTLFLLYSKISILQKKRKQQYILISLQNMLICNYMIASTYRLSITGHLKEG